MNIVLLIFEFAIQTLYSKQTNCSNLTMIPNTIFYTNNSELYILEGDDDDYININQINQEILERQFIIPYEGELIQIKIINSIEGDKIEEKLICSLFRKSEYIISCIQFESIYFKNKNSLVEKIKLETNISSQLICDEMYYQDNGFYLLCSKNNNLIKYHITLFNQISIELIYDVQIQIEDGCKKQQMFIENNQIFIVYYQCSKWQIIQMDKKQVLIILRYDMEEQYPSISEFTFINDIQFCRKQKLIALYLIEKNQYIFIIYNIPNNFKYIQFEKYERELQKMVVDKYCTKTIMITKVEEPYKYFTQQQQTEIGLQEHFKSSNIHYYSDFIFLQNKTQLTILIDFNINQTYNILDTRLTFVDQYNLFYQIDSYNKVLQINRYFPLLTYIKPKLKYLFVLSKSQFNKDLLKCYKISYKNNTQGQSKNQIIIPLDISCERTYFFFFTNTQFLSQEYFLQPLIKQEINVLNISIWNNEKFDKKCYKNFMHSHKFDEINLKIIIRNNYLYLMTKILLIILDCENTNILAKININKITVFEYGGILYLYDQDNNTFKEVQIINTKIQAQQIFFDQQIQSIKQVQSHLIIKIQNQKLPLLIEMTFMQVFQLSNNLYQNEEILYYKKKGDYIFIQYSNILAFELEGNIKCFQLQEVNIFQISSWIVSNQFLIFAVKYQTNTIIMYYFDLFQLLEISNYTFYNYTFSYPLKYIVSDFHFVLLLEKNNFKYLAILYHKENSLQLVDIIETTSVNFVFNQNNLLYYDINKELSQRYLNGIRIEVKYQQIWDELFSSYQIDLKFPSQKEENQESSQNFQLQIKNACYNIYSRQNKIEINLFKGQNFQVNLSNYFYGPINHVILKNHQIKLKGPLQFNLIIPDCIDHNSLFCYHQFYAICEKNQRTLSFDALIFQNQIFLKQLPNNISTQILDTFWLSDSNILMVINFNGYLHFSLLRYSDETFFEISYLNTFLKISQIGQKIIKTGNLILINNTLHQIHYYLIQNQTIIQLQNQDNFLDLLYIENSTDLYVALNELQVNYALNIQLKVYKINLEEFKIIYSKVITSELNILFSEYFPYTIAQLLNLKELKFLQCNILQDTIFVNIFFLFNQFSFLGNCQFNILNNSIPYFKLLKQIRNFVVNDVTLIKIHYLDDNFLVLKQYNPLFLYIYDLRQDMELIDYIQNTSSNVFIQRINNTHYIFTNNESVAYLGSFGYEIEFENSNVAKYNFVLQAENSISLAEFHMQITINKNKFHQNWAIEIQLSLNMFFILIYIKKCHKKRNVAKFINRNAE